MKRIIIISGPSGVGKNSLISEALKNTKPIKVAISHNTRSPRSGEASGVHRHFVTRDKFEEMMREGLFIETNEHFHNLYGLTKSEVSDHIQSSDVLIESDVNGAMEIKRQFPEVKMIFISPPSLEDLKSRLLKRGTESPEMIHQRLERSALEMDLKNKFDCIVVNDVFEEAALELASVIEKLRT